MLLPAKKKKRKSEAQAPPLCTPEQGSAEELPGANEIKQPSGGPQPFSCP